MTGFAAQAQLPFGGMSAAKGKGRISGGVIDSISRSALEYVTISLRKAGETQPIDGVVTDGKGMFALKEIKNGVYDVKVSFIGYEDKLFRNITINDSLSTQMLGKVILAPVQKLLDEVTITGKQMLVENKIDKIVYNASADITNKGGNAADLLRKVPTLSVDLDGNVYMRGSQNIKVLINGKPSAVMAANVSEAMKMIPSDEIEKVEVITSPGAKYDAEGSAGIINIITKKKVVKGVSGSMNVSAGTRSSFLGANTNVKYDKWGFNVGLGGFGWKAKGRMDATRSLTASDLFELTQGGETSTKGIGGRGNFGVDYDITDKDNVNASVSYSRFKMNIDNSILTSQKLMSQEVDHYTRNIKSENLSSSVDATLDYKHKFNRENQELTMSGQFSNNLRPTGYELDQYNALEIKNYYEQSNNSGKNRENTIQLDYSHPFTKKLNLDAGVKSIFRRIESIYSYDTLNFATNQIVSDQNRNSAFGYLQDVLSAYTEGVWYVDDHWGIKAGVRYEMTKNKGDIFQSERNLNQTYDNILPSGTVSYKFGSSSVKVSYNQRLQRPSLFYLNPYSNQSDVKNVTRGNPRLEAELTNNVELGYSTYFGISSINVALYNRSTNNAIEAVRSLSGDTLITSYYNQAKNNNTGLNLSGNLMFGYKFMLAGNFDLSYVNVENKSLGIQNSGFNYGINGFLNWTVIDKWGFQGYAGIRSPTITARGRSTSFYFYGLGIKRDLLNKKATLSLGVDNFLTPTQKLKTDYEINGLKYSSVNQFNAFGARISFNWMFGKMQFSNKQKSKGIDNTDLKAGDDGRGAGGGMR